MKINQVEQLVGITKGNIRFYEKEGLLTPGRNNENGYRDYSDADVAWLKKIKLLRMLDVPIEEILRLKSGALTLEDAMGRHIIQLERRQANLAAAQGVCVQIRDSRSQLDGLDADGVLASMERQEQEGTKFMNVGKQDKLTRYVSPVGAAVVVLVMMAAFLALIVWGFTVSPEDAPPIGVIIGLAAIPVIVIIGVLAALYRRIKQIKGGDRGAVHREGLGGPVQKLRQGLHGVHEHLCGRRDRELHRHAQRGPAAGHQADGGRGGEAGSRRGAKRPLRLRVHHAGGGGDHGVWHGGALQGVRAWTKSGIGPSCW